MRLDAYREGWDEPEYEIWLSHEGPYSTKAFVHVLNRTVLHTNYLLEYMAINIHACAHAVPLTLYTGCMLHEAAN